LSEIFWKARSFKYVDSNSFFIVLLMKKNYVLLERFRQNTWIKFEKLISVFQISQCAENVLWKRLQNVFQNWRSWYHLNEDEQIWWIRILWNFFEKILIRSHNHELNLRIVICDFLWIRTLNSRRKIVDEDCVQNCHNDRNSRSVYNENSDVVELILRNIL
jgi:CO dehydrogenase/acetyl-CoA synthase beta subunit